MPLEPDGRVLWLGLRRVLEGLVHFAQRVARDRVLGALRRAGAEHPELEAEVLELVARYHARPVRIELGERLAQVLVRQPRRELEVAPQRRRHGELAAVAKHGREVLVDDAGGLRLEVLVREAEVLRRDVRAQQPRQAQLHLHVVLRVRLEVRRHQRVRQLRVEVERRRRRLLLQHHELALCVRVGLVQCAQLRLQLQRLPLQDRRLPPLLLQLRLD
mmetsp:Transcript_18780/g.50926  ORF Transcript_18780/g.50926 Transcript_18780/m.50926 type:complete len:217 (+) Transcript_18780:950-1600(+)